MLTGNTFAVLSDIKDNDDLDGGVKLPPSNDNDDHPAGNDNDGHPAGEQDEDDLQDLPPVQEVLRTAYSQGSVTSEMRQWQAELTAGKVPQFMKTNRVEPSDCLFVQGMLMVNRKLFVPDYFNLRTRFIQEHHDSPIAGHQGIGRTFELLGRTVFWPRM